MSTASDARFWDRTSRRYARSAVADQAAYERTLARTREWLKPGDSVLELGCGTGSTALHLAGGVRHYLATDIAAGMIAIAEEKLVATPVPGLAFRTATVEALQPEAARFDAVLGFNLLHLVRDLPGTLRGIQALLTPGGLFVSKTSCLGDLNPFARLALLPVLRVMQAVGKAPHAAFFRAEELRGHLIAAGFEVVAVENHAVKGGVHRPYIVARKQ